MPDAPIPSSLDNARFGARIIALAAKLAGLSETPDGLTCTFLTPTHRAVAAQLQSWMREAGLDAHIDGVGNVIGRYPASDPSARTLVVGSHYDTVRNGGQFDGRLGVLAGLIALEAIIKSGRKLPFHIDLIAFSEEEGVRFGAPYIGSSAIAGNFDDKLLERRDANGQSLAELLRESGFDPGQVGALARRADELAGYIELHIEQGPVLLEETLPVGIVTGIAGAARYDVAVTGSAGHAGTTPMNLRRDAGTAAAEMTLYVEKRCALAPGLVGTVGRIVVLDGAINVIPGRCEFSLDIRAADDTTLAAAIADVTAEFEAIAARRKVAVKLTELRKGKAVPCSPRIQQQLAQAIERAGIKPRYLSSGAGHDAAMFGPITDIGMLFVRCGNGGISHSPLETVTAKDADVATRILIDTIVNFTLGRG